MYITRINAKELSKRNIENIVKHCLCYVENLQHYNKEKKKTGTRRVT